MNLDDLIPKDVLIKKRTFQEVSDDLHARNLSFFSRNEHHLQKYLSTSRIVAVVASTSVVADVVQERPKFNNFSQWTIWTIPNLNPLHKNVINEFRSKIIG